MFWALPGSKLLRHWLCHHLRWEEAEQQWHKWWPPLPDPIVCVGLRGLTSWPVLTKQPAQMQEDPWGDLCTYCGEMGQMSPSPKLLLVLAQHQ